MTINEIEETLHELQTRHPGLDEALLVTLLRSGGWEEKNINEAILLFRSGKAVPNPVSKKAPELLPALETEVVLMPQVDGDHLLVERALEAEDIHEIKTQEQTSLVEAFHSPQVGKDELPHNLPLRPFETSDHIWPFARYKEVFFGDDGKKSLPEVSEVPSKTPAHIDQTPMITELPEIEINTEPKYIAPSTIEEKRIKKEYAKDGDEKLVVTACAMLLAILLLLGYMYSNGRL